MKRIVWQVSFVDRSIASIVAGIVYYALQIRHQTKMRQIDLVMRLWQQSCGEENVKAWSRLTSAEYQDLNEFVKKYGHPFSENSVPIAFGIDRSEGPREEFSIPEILEWFEYLYNEMKKREQRRSIEPRLSPESATY